MKVVFEAPRKIGQIDGSVFDALRRAVTSPQKRADFISDNGEVNPRFADLQTLMRPLYEHYVSLYGRGGQPLYSVDTNVVAANQRQRPSSHCWHCDGLPGVQTSNMLPTEFLINDPDARLSKEQEARRKTLLDGIDDLHQLSLFDDALITKLGFKIYTAKPREVVAFTTHLHRSPANNTRKDIPRVWMRIE